MNCITHHRSSQAAAGIQRLGLVMCTSCIADDAWKTYINTLKNAVGHHVQLYVAVECTLPPQRDCIFHNEFDPQYILHMIWASTQLHTKTVLRACNLCST